MHLRAFLEVFKLQVVSRSLKADMIGSFYTGGAEKYLEAGRAKDPPRRSHEGGVPQYGSKTA